jgi:hypothetical protein
MSNWLKVVSVIVMVLAVVLVGCAPKAAPAAPGKTITIGILGSLTGPLRSIGEGAICVHDYWTELNATQGGIKYKDPQTGKEEVVNVKVLMGDHAWDMAKCVSLYERFKAEGMQLAYANGSAPTAAIYAAAARDHIPGIQVDTTCDPFIYETETKPYLAMDGPTLPAYEPGVVAWHVQEWKKAGKPGKVKIGMLAADVATRRVLDKPELGYPQYLSEVLGNDLDYLGTAYMPVAPVDVKGELTQFIQKGANVVLVEHWGSGACRVLINDAIALEMHKKGINLNIMWLPSDVPLAEPKLFDEYNKYARVQACSHGWGGSEPPEIVAKYPGLKLAFDLCAKYHDGQKPEQRAGWYYVYGAYYGMVGRDALKQTLEKNGWSGFSTEKLRDTLFGLSPIESGGLLPTYYPDTEVFITWPCLKIVNIQNGHIITDEQSQWMGFGNTKVYPNLNIRFAEPDKVWIPPSWK